MKVWQQELMYRDIQFCVSIKVPELQLLCKSCAYDDMITLDKICEQSIDPVAFLDILTNDEMDE